MNAGIIPRDRVMSKIVCFRSLFGKHEMRMKREDIGRGIHYRRLSYVFKDK